MIYAVTSRKGGCGRSTVALLLSILTQAKINGKIALADFSYGNDLMSLLKLSDKYPSLDNLISSIALELDLDFNRNLVEAHGFFLLPGTRVNQTRYLEKRYSELVYILKEMETKFNAIILDIDYSLYEELVDSGLEITPFYVLEQNMLNIEKYQSDIRKQMFDGYYVLNKYNSDIFPSLDLFEKNFKVGSVVCVLEDDNLTSILNKKKVALSVINNSPAFSGINKLSTIVSNNLTIVDSEFIGIPKKKGFFRTLFGGKSSTVREINSVAGMVKPDNNTASPSKKSSTKKKSVQKVSKRSKVSTGKENR